MLRSDVQLVLGVQDRFCPARVQAVLAYFLSGGGAMGSRGRVVRVVVRVVVREEALEVADPRT